MDEDRTSIIMTVTAGASGAPGGFTVEWMTQSDHDVLGWPNDPNHPALARCDFTGTPTLTTTLGVVDFALGTNASVRIEIGDLFDETGVYSNEYTELQIGGGYVFRVFARPSEGTQQSDYSTTLSADTNPEDDDCILSQGYWKNHPEAWPVSGLQLGDVDYTKSELLDILKQPARGNGLVFLSHQLIATKLNIQNGANPTLIQSAVDAAEQLIGSLVVPPIGMGYLAPPEASPLTEVLDRFNNGKGGGTCGTVAAERTDWGALKTRYR
ncbi:MAG: hypothetical protein JSW67_03440 [Candidatus Latescibacterota bacterium]|nr:MAG: hypothetical protein JSW67_03440 [Candidatus Latescibacterota bacterium]